jgi:hypothetical protein
VKEEKYSFSPSDEKQYKLKAIDQLAIGSIVTLWGSLLALKQIGIIGKDISTLPFIFVAFGILLVFGGIYRLISREKTPRMTAS